MGEISASPGAEKTTSSRVRSMADQARRYSGAAAALCAHITVVLLLVPAFAFAQNCLGVMSHDVCEQGIFRVSDQNVYTEKRDLSTTKQKIAVSVRQAGEAIEAALLSETTSTAPGVSPNSVRVTEDGEIHVYVMLTEFRPEYVAQLAALGMQIELTLAEFRLVQGWVPVNLLELVADLDFVTEVK